MEIDGGLFLMHITLLNNVLKDILDMDKLISLRYREIQTITLKGLLHRFNFIKVTN